MTAAAPDPAPAAAPNLYQGSEPRDFWLWLSPHDLLARQQLNEVGGFFSFNLPGLPGDAEQIFPFVPNPRFTRSIAPFQGNLLWDYFLEYNLEQSRSAWFPAYPSRLLAIFLLESETDAHEYALQQRRHVAGRVLKRAYTEGDYTCSRHDAAWVDLMRVRGNHDADFLGPVTRAYWAGELVADSTTGTSWRRDPLMEVLFYGTVKLYDLTL
jgi:hypothetical protein